MFKYNYTDWYFYFCKCICLFIQSLNFRNFWSPSKGALMPRRTQTLLLPPGHIITQCVVFYVWLLSPSIIYFTCVHFVARIIFCFLLFLHSIPLHEYTTYPFTSERTSAKFPFLTIINNTPMNICIHIFMCVHKFSFFFINTNNGITVS